MRALIVVATSVFSLLGALSASANEPPVAVDDQYETPADVSISVDSPGVLGNDTDADGDALSALLVQGPDPLSEFTLFSDGAFEYRPPTGFVGTDSFTYVASDGAADSNVATVLIVVTDADQRQVFADETLFRAAVQASGLILVREGFEDDPAWGHVRSSIVDGNHTAPSVSNLGITWTSNNATSEVTTSEGAALRGAWGFYSLPHGSFATGVDCHLPGNCGDGWIATSGELLMAVGGWVRTNTPFASLELYLDGDFGHPVDFADSVLGTQFEFFGVIDPNGFHAAEFRELEGVAEDQKFIFGDEFFFGVVPAGLSLSVTGSCPGVIEMAVAGSPNSRVRIYGSRNPGSSTVPGGSCAGTPLDLTQPRNFAGIRTDSNGDGSVSRRMSAGQCGLWVQALEVDSCSTSQPTQVP